MLVFIVARSICGLTRVAATFAGVLFAVLPIHAAAVAWISGRADSIPSLFYLSGFLLFALWRRRGGLPVYVGSMVLCILALFSKQSGITFVATIALFDFLVERRIPNRSWSFLLPYIPFLAVTFGYLGLRYVLFGNVVREQAITDWTFASFGLLESVNFGLLALGWHAGNVDLVTFFGPGAVELTLLGFGFTLWALVVLVAEARKVMRNGSSGRVRYVWYFGLVWWLIGSAPLAVTYVSPRHLYLVGVGAAIVLGIAFDAVWKFRGRFGVVAASAGALAMIAIYGSMLHAEVDGFNRASNISEEAVRYVEREASVAPAGSLFVIQAPSEWTWGMPYIVRPPIIGSATASRVNFISNREASCCPDDGWDAGTREVVTRWAEQPEMPPAIVLRWDPAGTFYRTTSADQPALRPAVQDLVSAGSADELKQRLKTLFDQERL